MLNRRTLTIVAIVVILLLAGTILLLIGGSHQTAEPAPQDSLVASPSNSPSEEEEGESPEEEAKEKEIEAFSNQPILKALPHSTSFWSLEYVGSQGKTYRLLAHVFVQPGQDANAEMAKQRPFIQAFIDETGQPRGTYTLELQPVVLQQNFND